jgi:hypothetical protein
MPQNNNFAACCNVFHLPTSRVQVRIKMVRLHSCVSPFRNTRPGFSGKNANQIIKRTAIKGEVTSTRTVLTGSAVSQKKTLKASRGKNNFKRTVRNPDSSNSDKNDDSDCCE